MKTVKWPPFMGERNINMGLENILELLKRIGDPHKKLPPVIHIAGTNGKGSVSAFLQAMFTAQNYKVHLYRSPHLINFNERIIINGKEIEDTSLNGLLEECRQMAEQEERVPVTFFEGFTAAAFLAFSKTPADVLIMETGMGGRLDATNVVEIPLLSVITPISLDHQEYLGNDIEKITIEKCGIIKKNVPVIVGRQEKRVMEIIEQEAKKQNSDIVCWEKDWNIKRDDKGKYEFSEVDEKIIFSKIGLAGEHQMYNAGLAMATISSQNNIVLKEKNVINGVANAFIGARCQEIAKGKIFKILSSKNYEIIVDSAHNEAGAQVLSKYLMDYKKDNQKTYAIIGIMKDKNIQSFIKNIAANINFLVTVTIEGEKRSADAKNIAKEAIANKIQSVNADSMEQAFQFIEAMDNEERKKTKGIKNIFSKKTKNRIIICGSLYLAGQFMEKFV